MTFNLVIAINYPDAELAISYSGNLTNISQMQDVYVPSPEDNQILSWDSVLAKWIAQTFSGIQDTNESTRFNNLVGTDCTGTDKVSGVDNNGNLVCDTDETSVGGGDFSFTDFSSSFDSNTTALQNKVNSSYLTTYNSTYDAKISYNTTWNESRGNQLYAPIGSTGNASWNESRASLLYAGIIWGYNQSTPVFDYISLNEASWLSTYNETYANNLDTNDSQVIADSNASWLSTYNSTYDNYKTNVSTNWTELTYDTYNTIWSASSSDSWAGNYTNYYTKSQVDSNLSLYLLLTDQTYNETDWVLSKNYLTSYTETDPIWSANSSTVARIGNCGSGQVVQNTTTSGVECISVSGTGDFSFSDFQSSFDSNTTALQNKVNSSYLTTYNATYDAKVSDNTSWNEQRASGLYATIGSTGGDFYHTNFSTSFNSNLSATGLINNASYLSTYNSTYDAKISYNTTWNESRGNQLYAPIGSSGGNFYFQNFTNSFDSNTTALQSKVNSSYLRTDNSSYLLLSSFATSFNNNASGRWSNFNSTNFYSAFLSNMSGTSNRTTLSCSNITGSASNLCTITGGGNFYFNNFSGSFAKNFSSSFDLNTTALQNKVNSSYLTTYNTTYDSYPTRFGNFNTTNFYSAFVLNMTNTNNLTTLSCANITGSASNLCTLTSGSGGDFYHFNFTTAFDSNTTALQNKVNSSYLSTYNSTYDNYKTNVSTNWSLLTYNTWNAVWSAGGGDFSFTNFFNSFVLNMSGTANLTKLSWSNITSIPSDIADGDADTIFTPTNVAWINESNTFTPAQTFSNNVTVEGIKLEVDSSNHRIYDNATCIIMTGDTSTLEIC